MPKYMTRVLTANDAKLLDKMRASGPRYAALADQLEGATGKRLRPIRVTKGEHARQTGGKPDLPPTSEPKHPPGKPGEPPAPVDPHPPLPGRDEPIGEPDPTPRPAAAKGEVQKPAPKSGR